MRRRILASTMLVVAITALVLGVPLAISTWQLVEDFTRADLISRLEQISRSLAGDDSSDPTGLARIELAVPTGARLVLEQPGSPSTTIGADPGPDPIVETQVYGAAGTITLAEPRTAMRGQQLQLSGVVLVLVLVSVGAGAVVAGVTARRLVGPVEEVADTGRTAGRRRLPPGADPDRGRRAGPSLRRAGHLGQRARRAGATGAGAAR